MSLKQLIKPFIITSAIGLVSAMFYVINVNTFNDHILNFTHHSFLNKNKINTNANLFTLNKKILSTDGANMITGITFILTSSQQDEIAKVIANTVSNTNTNAINYENKFFEFSSILSDKLQLSISKFKKSSIAKTKHEITKTLISSLKSYQHN